jgi:chromate transporter
MNPRDQWKIASEPAERDSQSHLRPVLLCFLRLGAVRFDGPIVLAPHVRHDLVDERRWISSDDYLEGLAFSQLSPGPLAPRLGMYLGWVARRRIGTTLFRFHTRTTRANSITSA